MAHKRSLAKEKFPLIDDVVLQMHINGHTNRIISAQYNSFREIALSLFRDSYGDFLSSGFLDSQAAIIKVILCGEKLFANKWKNMLR